MHKIEVTGASDLASLFLHQGCFCIAYFTTYDRDNDLHDDVNCALLRGSSAPAGGWWYAACWSINPNRFYTYGGTGTFVYIDGAVYYAPYFAMKMRPWNCFTHHY